MATERDATSLNLRAKETPPGKKFVQLKYLRRTPKVVSSGEKDKPTGSPKDTIGTSETRNSKKGKRKKGTHDRQEIEQDPTHKNLLTRTSSPATKSNNFFLFLFFLTEKTGYGRLVLEETKTLNPLPTILSARNIFQTYDLFNGVGFEGFNELTELLRSGDTILLPED